MSGAATKKKIVTTVQIVLDVVHDEDLSPQQVAIVAASTAHDAVVWTDDPELSRATDGVETPVGLVSATVLASRPRDEGEAPVATEDADARLPKLSWARRGP
jgi:hypothetical protein